MNSNNRSGTTIKDLQYNPNISNSQYNQNTSFKDNTPQYVPLIDVQQNKQMQEFVQPDLNELAKEISSNISDEDLDKINKEPFVSDKTTNDKQKYIPDILIEALLLLIIYIILSQSFSIKFFSKFIPQLTAKPDSGVPFIGVLIYGIILAAVFFISRKFILQYV